MKSSYNQSSPNLFKDSDGNDVVHHNHFATIDYRSYGKRDKEQLNQIIDQQKVALQGCITFFQTLVDDKEVDGLMRATVASALEEDKARLKDFEDHKRSNCTIL